MFQLIHKHRILVMLAIARLRHNRHHTQAFLFIHTTQCLAHTQLLTGHAGIGQRSCSRVIEQPAEYRLGTHAQGFSSF